MTALETDLVKAVVFRGRRVGYPLHRRGVSSSPIVTGHNAPHELVEQRHGESSIPVAGTPDHAFGDQLISGWSQRGNLPVKCFSDIPGTVWPGTELGHRSQIFLFDGSQPVKPDAEETFVKCSNG